MVGSASKRRLFFGLAALVLVVAGLTVLNPRVAGFALAGVAAAAAIDYLSRDRKPGGSLVLRWVGFVLACGTLVAAFLLLLSVVWPVPIRVYPYATKGSAVAAARLTSEWAAPYRATATYRAREFDIREQFMLSPGLIASVNRSLRVRHEHIRPVAVPRRDGWSPLLENGSVLLVRTRRQHHKQLPSWPALKTTLTVTVSELPLGAGVVARPNLSSTLVLRAPKDLVASTDPAGEDTGGSSYMIRLDDGGGFTSTSAVRLRANTGWTRNPVVQQIEGSSLWKPLLWLVAILFSLLSETVRDWLKRALHLGKSAERNELPPAAAQPPGPDEVDRRR